MTTTLLGWKPELLASSANAEVYLQLFPEDEEKNADVDKKNLCSLTRSQIAEQLLNDIENIVKKEEYDSFSDWLEQKADLPIFDEIYALPSVEGLKPVADELYHLDEALSNADLTPPHSPKKYTTDSTSLPLERPSENLNEVDAVKFANGNGGRDVQPVFTFAVPAKNWLIDSVGCRQQSSCDSIFVDSDSTLDKLPETVMEISFLTAPPSPIADLEKEMAMVDEVVRSTAQSLESNLDLSESETSVSQFSSSGSVNSFGSPRSPGAEDESDDPEWIPFTNGTVGKARRAAKSRPYARQYNQEDRRLRKKEQNKNAATRYRQKKKAEVYEILEEEKLLEDKKGKLEQRVADIRMEIKYLKSLMRDLFTANGLLIN